MTRRKKKLFQTLAIAAALGSLTSSSFAGTFVYVSNAEDGDISSYELITTPKAQLKPGARVPAAKLVMPMAASPDGRFLHAAARAKPFAVYSFRIDPKSGSLQWLGATPLPDSMVSISIDQTGQWLLGASYGGNSLSMNRIAANGRVDADPAQFFQSGGVKPHSIKTDKANGTVYVPHLATDEIKSYRFNAKSNTPIAEQGSSTPVKKGTGPRHFVVSPDDRFLYVLTELTGRVMAYQRDATSGALTEIQDISTLPENTKLLPGQPRVPVGTPGAIPFDETTAIWCADIQITPNGRFLYTSERTLGTLSQFEVDAKTGRLKFIGQVSTEKQPRGFAIDPQSQYLVASGEKSSTISLYAIDGSNGTLSLVEQVPVGKGANWVTIVRTEQ